MHRFKLILLMATGFMSKEQRRQAVNHLQNKNELTLITLQFTKISSSKEC